MFIQFLASGSLLLLHQHLRQQRLLGAGGGEALAQVGAQGAQGGYAGDDAGLFGEGWERERAILQLRHIDGRQVRGLLSRRSKVGPCNCRIQLHLGPNWVPLRRSAARLEYMVLMSTTRKFITPYRGAAHFVPIAAFGD